MTTDVTAVASAVHEVGEGMRADGFDLQLLSLLDGGVVEVSLEATSKACTDCLVPDQTLELILTAAIQEQASFTPAGIKIVKLGFDRL